MLKTLRSIVQEVNAAQSLRDALHVMVRRVREALQTETAAIYLIDNRNSEYVLMATEGLNPDAVGKVRIGLDQGLVGLIGRREEPINLENAQVHPDFYYHPDAKEEQYHAFLGVPVIHHRRLFGVLTVQQEEKRSYDESEEAFLVTIAAQLGGVIAHGESTGELASILPSAKPSAQLYEESSITGIASVSGVAIGQAVVVYPPADLDAVPDQEAESIDTELTLLNQAVCAVRIDIERLSERLSDYLPSAEQALFDVYLRILDSQSLGAEVEQVIRKEKLWAQAALRKVIKQHIQSFEAMDDDYLSERASDLRDLGRRVLAYLQASQGVQIEYPQDTILVGEEVTASALAEVPEGCLKGVVSSKGSNNSHVAIFARALGVPTIMGATGMMVAQLSEKQLIVDGYCGQVYVSPSHQLLNEFRNLAKEEEELNESLGELRGKPTETLDGHRIALHVNIGLAVDAGLSLSVGAEGVGLYRSEIPFLTRDRFPSEEEQRIIYRQLLKAFAPRQVTMRTLDVGGDKALSYFPVEEDNPFLGWRGIRITLDHPDVFLMQLRAMMQASVDLNNLRIMLPMISGVDELEEALHLVDQAYQEVVEEGSDIVKPKLGIMVEVPSAVYQARDLAKRVDFLSVGSNDLTQYILAVDRNNARVAGLYDALHPAVLRALMQVVEGGHSEGVQVGICGEMASDPLAVILLLAMGFDTLSMNSMSLPRVKWVVRNFTIAAARKILSEVLTMDSPTLIRFHLEKTLDQAGFGWSDPRW